MRCDHLINWVKEHGYDGAVITHPLDLFYLTGLQLSAGILQLSGGEPILWVDPRYLEVAKEHAPCRVELLGRPKFKGRIAFDSSTMSYAQYAQLSDEVELCPVERLMQQVRLIKEPDEIAALKEAAQLAVAGYEYATEVLQEGVSELEVAKWLQLFWMENGGEGVSFEPIVAFGKNGALPHHRAGHTCLQAGQSVLLDIGVQKAHYQSDLTRVVFFGEVSDKIEEIYAVVRAAYHEAVAVAKGGVLAGDVDRAARDLIASRGYGEAFVHSLGHGVGLDVHELPLLRNKAPWSDVQLEAGMVVTIEPGIYLPNVGGVRLEDTFLITESGCEPLTTPAVADPLCIHPA